jgi:DNA-directed RNA polymerase subunit RPC12/RpoP
MQASHTSNFRCRECGYKLVQVRVEDADEAREDSFCPNCLGRLPPRDGRFVVQYRFSEATGPSPTAA